MKRRCLGAALIAADFAEGAAVRRRLDEWRLSWTETPEEFGERVRAGVEADIAYVEVKAGGGSFHHGKTWHGSGANQSDHPRRSLVLHAMPSDVEYVPECFDQGIGPIYSRYKRLGDNQLDENYFPILWREDGYRTAQIDDYLSGK